MPSLGFAAPAPLRRASRAPRHRPRASAPRCAAAPPPPQYDVVVIGAGLGGLTAAALLSAAYDKTVCVLEAHTIPGGAAHAFTRPVPGRPDLRLTFDSGPHLHSGLRAGRPSSNPLRHALSAVGASVPVVTYPAWGCFFPEGYIAARVTSSAPLFSALVSAASGPAAAAEVAALVAAMRPLCAGATALPPAALRAGDVAGSVVVGARAARRRAAARGMGPGDAVRAVAASPQLMQPFKPLLDKYVKDPFANKFVDMLCFLLAGVRADKIPVAEVAFMFDEWTGGDGAVEQSGDEHGEEVLEHPVGGSAALVSALVDAVERGGSESAVRTGARVERLLLDDDRSVESGRRVTGVVLGSGERVMANHVVSNVSSWDFAELLAKSGAQKGDDLQSVAKRVQDRDAALPSFLHLHLAFEATPSFLASLPHQLEANYVSVASWDVEIDAPENVVLISMPSVIDSTCAPEGYHVLHAYTPATEPYELWEELESPEEYEALKKKRCQCLWDAVEKVIPNAREQAIVTMEGTPLTHEKFLNIHRGTYGPETDAGAGVGGMLPGQKRDDVAAGLWAVGASTFPGIGVPAVAASGWIAANGLVDSKSHQQLLQKIALV